jgi:hypothetical protein
MPVAQVQVIETTPNAINEVHMIRHIVEPRRLLLVWQSPYYAVDRRTRRIVAELVKENETVVFRYLHNSEDFKKAESFGFSPFPAFPDIKKEYINDIAAVFCLRLPPKKRRDYHIFLRSIRLPQNAVTDAMLSDFALLGYSEARLPGDGFSIVNPYDQHPSPCEFMSEVAGYRHNVKAEDYDDFPIGTQLSFQLEPNNEYDPNAVKISAHNTHIGYVNRAQTPAFKHWLENNTVKAYIEKKTLKNYELSRVIMFVEVT